MDKDKESVRFLSIIDDYPVTIPQLAIRGDAEPMRVGPRFNKQEHFSALETGDFHLSKILSEGYSCMDRMKTPFELVQS